MEICKVQRRGELPLCLWLLAISCNNPAQLLAAWYISSCLLLLPRTCRGPVDLHWRPLPAPAAATGPAESRHPLALLPLPSPTSLPPFSFPSLSSILLKWQQTDVSLCKDQMKSMALGLFTKEQRRLHQKPGTSSHLLCINRPGINLAAITQSPLHGQRGVLKIDFDKLSCFPVLLWGEGVKNLLVKLFRWSLLPFLSPSP